MEAVINIISIDLEFSEKGLCLPFLEKNSHGHTCGSNKAIGIFFSIKLIYFRFG